VSSFFGNSYLFQQNRTKNILKAAFCTYILIFLAPISVQAQLSPGKLAQAHENLEGLKNCGKCHMLGSQDVTAKCLACHSEIKTMQDKRTGLHGSSEYSRCVDCHVDHQGRNFELVHWPDGMDKFDHAKTGHELQGAHQDLACRKCHKTGFIKQPEQLKKQGKNLAQTFLGLEPNCTTCHEDIHQKQFANQCVSCHNQSQWKPAALFAHEKTAFPLTGLHGKVACSKCHRSENATTQYTNIVHNQCTSCHTDPHKEGYGADCLRCHDTTGWRNIRGEGFNHDLTRYKLEGKHQTVSCESCHRGNRKKPAFDRCAFCHQDIHESRVLKRPHLLECESCHNVQGFKPGQYGLTLHQESSFPLAGAHRAVPCQSCHQKKTKTKNWAMKLLHETCTSCHVDPHLGRMAKLDNGQGCIACHSQDTWGESAFDHGRTSFPLSGAHGRVACVSCHGTENTQMDKTNCGQCHADPHQGQFGNILLADKKTIDCARCHVTIDWFAERFDHEKDSRFPLLGGHQNVACTTCHQVQDSNNQRLLLYKPVSIECVACHKDTPQIKEEK